LSCAPCAKARTSPAHDSIEPEDRAMTTILIILAIAAVATAASRRRKAGH
jgi:hypothetical protein